MFKVGNKVIYQRRTKEGVPYGYSYCGTVHFINVNNTYIIRCREAHHVVYILAQAYELTLQDKPCE